jgi:hypothetical protein
VPTLSTPVQHSPGIPSQSNKARRRKKGIQIGKQIIKLSLFTDDMILHLKDPKNSTPKLLGTINSFSNVADTKSTYKNQYTFYIPIMNRLRRI